ncbi:MAG: transposase [Melioribacteraceae bacterium]|nr:transposase [Melioribacteraceae bacterium]
MPYRDTKFLNDCYYHVYNRGVNHSNIFLAKRNYYFFLEKVNQYLSPCLEIVAYCLMPNHFHLLILVKREEEVLTALKKLFLSYSKSFNKETNRSGPLFEGRYKSKLVPDNDYLLHLTRYIHLNPVRAKLVSEPDEWKFSSYPDYIKPSEISFVSKNIILKQVKDYRSFVKSYQEFDKEKLAELLFG